MEYDSERLSVMARKKFKTDGIYFTGQSSNDVTGSQYLVKFGDKQCLLECGLYQSSKNDYLDSYKVNSAKFDFKPSEIDYLFVNHPHVDHCGLIPRLVKEGFNGKIIATSETAAIMNPLLYNSCFILEDEARVLSKRYKRNYEPIYEKDDVEKALSLIKVYNEYNTIFHLDDVVSFQWFNNSHCLGAAQLQLILSDERKTRRILYTSDLGALHTKNHYLVNTEIPAVFNDVSIMESTYGNSKRTSHKTRAFDIDHLRTAIDTVMERNGTVIFPCFSFSRTQEILTTLYELYGNEPNFNIPIFVDSKLSCDISDLYCDLLHGENAELWDKVYNWNKVRFIVSKPDSRNCVADSKRKIVISSSGFCTNGRVISYLQKYIEDENSMVIFSGYTGDNSSYLSYRIKNYRDDRTISINKKSVMNRADCITLSTFSSHPDHNDLVTFGSSLNTNRLILVHGSEESKACLRSALEDAISKNNKSYKVQAATKDMVVRL